MLSTLTGSGLRLIDDTHCSYQNKRYTQDRNAKRRKSRNNKKRLWECSRRTHCKCSASITTDLKCKLVLDESTNLHNEACRDAETIETGSYSHVTNQNREMSIMRMQHAIDGDMAPVRAYWAEVLQSKENAELWPPIYKGEKGARNAVTRNRMKDKNKRGSDPKLPTSKKDVEAAITENDIRKQCARTRR